MANEEVNEGRRRFLTNTTATVGAIGAGFAGYAFMKSWQPSAKAQSSGAPVELDISKIDQQPGAKITTKWRGQPIFVFKRNDAQMAELSKKENLDRLKDANSENADQTPVFAKNATRTLKDRPEIAVLVAFCTHLGCIPLHVPQISPQPFDSKWPGGFYCPCHNSRFDLAGRVFEGSPAPSNLKVPPYQFLTEDLVQLGVAPEGAA